MDKAALFANRLPREEVEIPDVGTITIRALSRYEVLLVGKSSNGDTVTFERKMLALAMVDPEMTEEDVALWQQASGAGEMGDLVKRVNELSGLGKDMKEAQKAAYKSFRDDSGA